MSLWDLFVLVGCIAALWALGVSIENIVFLTVWTAAVSLIIGLCWLSFRKED